MATRTKKPPTSAKQESKAYPQMDPIHGLTGEDLVGMMARRVAASEAFWKGKHYNLEKTTEENTILYLGEQTLKKEEEDEDNISGDNRIFSAVQTVVPYVTSRITQPEVYPSSKSAEARNFAADFEKALYVHADNEKVTAKMAFAVEDAIIRRRGYLKPRYDAATKNFCLIEYIPCESVIIDHKAKAYEEPRYARFCLEKSVDDLVIMFPEMKQAIMDAFKLPAGAQKADMEQERTVYEDWLFVDTEEGLDLIVFWNYNKVGFGAIQDPNWRYGKQNFLKHHMIPLVPVNVLSDGRTWVDKTSFVEQAKYPQKTIDKRGEQIGENAGLGNIGMPVVDSAALADDQAQNVVFEPDLVLELEVPEGKSVNDVFTTWKAGTLSPDVYKDKADAIVAVENAFGASSVQQGNQTSNNTLGQDELLRDTSQGRQQKIVAAIDNATARLYPFIAQFLLVYGDEEEMFPFVGEDAEFDCIIMRSSTLDTKCQIRVKSGTSMPIDRTQRRATADKAAGQQMIDPLTYWEIMDEPNAQKIAKRVSDYTRDPNAFMQDVNEEVFDRDAYSDIELLKDNKEVPYRDELSKTYFDYLNQYILSGALENPDMPPATSEVISQFIDIQLQRGQKMLGMAETQLPTAQDVQAHNQQVDEANAANAAATKGIPPPPKPGIEKPAESGTKPKAKSTTQPVTK